MTNSSIDLSQMAVLVGVQGGKPQMTKKDKDATQIAEEGMSAHDSGNFVKRLWPKHLMQPIITAELNYRNTVRSFGMPYARGWVLVPNSLRLRLDEALIQPGKAYQLAVDALFMNYSNVLAVARQQLGAMYDDSIYPDASELKSQFSLSVVYMPAPNTASLAFDEYGKTLQQRLEVYQGNMLRDSTREVIGKLAETITNLSDKLRRKIEQETSSDSAANKRAGPRFHDSLTENLQHLLDVIPELNFTNDPNINSIVTEARLKLNVSNEVLKNGSLSVKETILNDAEALLKKMQGMY